MNGENSSADEIGSTSYTSSAYDYLTKAEPIVLLR